MSMGKYILSLFSAIAVCASVVFSINMFNGEDINSSSEIAAITSFESTGDMQKSSNLAMTYSSLENEATCGQYSSFSCSSSCSSSCSGTCSGCCSHKCSQRCRY